MTQDCFNSEASSTALDAYLGPADTAVLDGVSKNCVSWLEIEKNSAGIDWRQLGVDRSWLEKSDNHCRKACGINLS